MSVGTREANLNHNEIAPAVDVFLSTIPSMDWCKGKLGKPRYFRGKQWFPLRFPLNQFILYRAWLKIDDPILRWFSSDQTTGPYRPNPHLLFPKEPHNDASILMDTNMANISIFFVFFFGFAGNISSLFRFATRICKQKSCCSFSSATGATTMAASGRAQCSAGCICAAAT